MAKLTRRSLLRNSFGLVAAGTLARPHIANAAATTAAVWWVQGFAQEEDVSFKKIVADYEKTSSNTIDYNIVPYAPMRQKIVSAMTSGVVPDLFQNTPAPGTGLHPKASDLAAPHCLDPMRPEKDPSRHFLVFA
jgi:multiple sugar transport system substrate-binding protein